MTALNCSLNIPHTSSKSCTLNQICAVTCTVWSQYAFSTVQLFFFGLGYHGNSQGELCYPQLDRAAKIIFISTSPFLIQPQDWLSSQVSRCSLRAQQFPRMWQEVKNNLKKDKEIRAKRQSGDHFRQKKKKKSLHICWRFDTRQQTEMQPELKISIRAAQLTHDVQLGRMLLQLVKIR